MVDLSQYSKPKMNRKVLIIIDLNGRQFYASKFV